MDAGHRTFIAGMVLGAAVGLAAGHFTLWQRAPVGTPYFAQPAGKLQPVSESEIFTTAELPLEATDLTTAFALAPAGLDSATLATESSPLKPKAAAFDALAPELLPLPQAKPGLLAGKSPLAPATPLAEPAPLQVPDASPLADQPQESTPDATAAIRNLIEQELGNRPQHEQDVWFDSLKDLSLPHAVGVLEMWKLSGRGGPAGGLGGLPDEPLFQLAIPEVQRPVLGARPVAQVDAAIQLHLQNLEHAATPGYKRLVPSRLDRNAGAVGYATQIDFSQGLRRETGLPLDWCIVGMGFFHVTDGTQSFYTRCGHFTLNADREIVLAIGEQLLKLSPTTQIPVEATSIELTQEGQLLYLLKEGGQQKLGRVLLAQFINPAALKPMGSILFEETPASGAAQHIASPELVALQQVQQGALELSNVDSELEWSLLELRERLLEFAGK